MPEIIPNMSLISSAVLASGLSASTAQAQAYFTTGQISEGCISLQNSDGTGKFVDQNGEEVSIQNGAALTFYDNANCTQNANSVVGGSNSGGFSVPIRICLNLPPQKGPSQYENDQLQAWANSGNAPQGWPREQDLMVLNQPSGGTLPQLDYIFQQNQSDSSLLVPTDPIQRWESYQDGECDPTIPQTTPYQLQGLAEAVADFQESGGGDFNNQQANSVTSFIQEVQTKLELQNIEDAKTIGQDLIARELFLEYMLNRDEE